MERWKKEESYCERKNRSTDIWKYIPKKLDTAIENCEANDNGYWIYLMPDFVAYDGAEDCGIIHEYLISDLKEAIKTIRPGKR